MYSVPRLAPFLALCCALPLTLAAAHNDSDWDRERGRGGPDGRIVLFADPNYEGEGIEIFAGDDFPDLRRVQFADGRAVNDRVSSIRIEGRAKLRIYADPNFNGDSLELTGDVPDLRRLARSRDGRISWDDSITALRSEGTRRRPEPDRHQDREHGPDWDQDRRRIPQIIVYGDPNFEGEGLAIDAGADLPDLRRSTFGSGRKSNDKISSIRIERGARAQLFTDPNFNGDVLEITESIADLRQLRRPGANQQWTWDDCISAIRVDRAGRRGDDDRRPGSIRPSRDPDPWIRTVYRDLLGHDPDANTLSQYRRLVLQHDWNDDMLRAEITRSPEYRNREAQRIIQRAYRELLDREPDRDGYENFRRKIVEGNWSEQDVRTQIMRSDEYRRRKNAPRPDRPSNDRGARPRGDETDGTSDRAMP